MSRDETIQQLSRDWNDAWNSGDAARLAAFMAPGSTYYEPGLDGPTDGPAGLRDAAEKTWRDWPGAGFELVTLTVQGDRSVVEWRSTATHRSGVEVELQGVDILEWSGDKVQAARVYYDVHERALALED